MSEEEKVKQKVREAFREGYKAKEKGLELDQVLQKMEGEQA